MAWDLPGEVETMLSDSPHTFTVGATTHLCLFEERDEPGESLNGAAPQMMHLEVATIRTADFPALKGSDAITIKELDPMTGAEVWSRNYIYFKRAQNGALTDLLLRRA